MYYKSKKNLYCQKGYRVRNTGKENKVLKRHIYLTGSNKVPILDKCPLDKSPTSVKVFIYNCNKRLDFELDNLYMINIQALNNDKVHENRCRKKSIITL